MSANNTKGYRWRFFRSGGFDQVVIDKADDLHHLDELDQKLWTVLACPTSGLEFDARTLQLLDTDGDGCIRPPEIIAAARWVCDMLRAPEGLFRADAALPLAAIADDHPAGALLLATARRVLAYLGKPAAGAIAVADFADPACLFAPDHDNGDGIVPAELATDPAQAALIDLIGAHYGTLTDRSGRPGVDQARVTRFFADLQQVADWHAHAEADVAATLPYGTDTAAAIAAFDACRDKVEDFFTRCRLAAFDARAAEALNPGAPAYAELAPQALAAGAPGVEALPLALVAADQALPLAHGLNPAWEARIAALREQVVRPVHGERSELSWAEWQALSARFVAYRAWLAAQPAVPVAGLAPAEVRSLLDSAQQAELDALIARDLAAETAAAQVDALERLVRYHRDLVPLLRNFVSLADFYAGGQRAIFQAGTLYIDQRSCELCLRVSDMARHAAMAPLTGNYLLYCECVRQGEAPFTIVAVVTRGDTHEMMVPGRNGVFYDRQGRDWNARVVKVVDNPISVRQAFWTPYKRIGGALGAQVRKFFDAQAKAAETKAVSGLGGVGATAVEAGGAPPAAPAAAAAFDIAKFAGIFAAIGLALGAIGTALAAVVTGFLSLPVWEMPLVIGGVAVLVSGPSMVLAWLKLRQRSLGPLLDANGWAVNSRARINIPFGASLTRVAQLPPGASRALTDPYAEKRGAGAVWLLFALLVALAVLAWRQGWLAAGLAALGR